MPISTSKGAGRGRPRRPRLFCFGYGYTARALALDLRARFSIAGTVRDPQRAAAATDAALVTFASGGRLPAGSLARATHVLVSIPPDASGDPVLEACGAELARRAGQFAWIGYLSTTVVYGDRQGDWVDESATLAAVGERGRRRVEAEAGWLDLWRQYDLPVHVFRLAGIYGPGRNVLDQLRAGTARRIVKPGQVFSRIHVADIVAVLEASMARPRPGAVYNVADDEAAPPQDLVAHAARLLGVPPPPEEPFATARMSEMARSFYAECKRVRNDLIKKELGVSLRYPTYREGLAALLSDNRSAEPA